MLRVWLFWIISDDVELVKLDILNTDEFIVLTSGEGLIESVRVLFIVILIVN
jgi:hypothetical protein